MIRWATRRPAVVWAASLVARRGGGRGLHPAAARHPAGGGAAQAQGRRRLARRRRRAGGVLYHLADRGAIQGVRGVKKVSSESTDGDARTHRRPRARRRRPARPARHPRAAGAAPAGLSARRARARGQQLRPGGTRRTAAPAVHHLRTVHRRHARQAGRRTRSLPRITAVEGVAGVNRGGGAEQRRRGQLRRPAAPPAGHLARDALCRRSPNARVVRSLGTESRRSPSGRWCCATSPTPSRTWRTCR